MVYLGLIIVLWLAIDVCNASADNGAFDAGARQIGVKLPELINTRVIKPLRLKLVICLFSKNSTCQN